MEEGAKFLLPPTRKKSTPFKSLRFLGYRYKNAVKNVNFCEVFCPVEIMFSSWLNLHLK
jgi:hypothetical protein